MDRENKAEPTPQRRAEDFLIETVSGSWNSRKERLIKMYETQDALVAALRDAQGLLDRAQEEMRLIRMKDCGVIYDTMVRIEIDIAREKSRAALALATSGETRTINLDPPGTVSP